MVEDSHRLDVRCVGKHVHRAGGRTAITRLMNEESGVTGQRRWIAAHIHDASGFCLEQHFANIFMHTCPRRIGNYHIGLTMLLKKFSVEQIFNITKIKFRVRNVVDQ